MQKFSDQLMLPASDISNHLGCRHLTALDIDIAQGRIEAPAWQDPMLESLQQRGLEHEEAYLDHLRAQGKEVRTLDAEMDASPEATLRAMQEGVDVIVQAYLVHGRWRGWADVLQKVSRASELGDWSYEVLDTKLARETRAGTVLQLCLYSEIVGALQGSSPEYMYVVTPVTEEDADFNPECFRVQDYMAFYRFVKDQLEKAVEAAEQSAQKPYPEPVPQCDVCRWFDRCRKRRRSDDHLSLVAGVSRLQQRELQTRDIKTLAALAQQSLPLVWTPKRGAKESYERAGNQARVQWEARERGNPVYEFLPCEPERGFARLPEPSEGDVFFDIEGDPFVGTAGLEYLLGWAVQDEHDEPEYRELWALNAEQEKSSFEAFIDEMMARWGRFPDMHIYHFAPYETSAMKRLMSRYATREDEVDSMLRAGLFVDLCAVTKQGLRASVESYSIKELEQFYSFTRRVALQDANKHLRAFDRALELKQTEEISDEMRDAVRAYNRDDCVSTLCLRDWLEKKRAECIEQGNTIERPTPKDGAASDAVSEQQERTRELAERLLEDVPIEREERSEEQHARWLLAHMLDWHRREAKVSWWEYFRLAELEDEELRDERVGLAGLKFKQCVDDARLPVDRYEFPPQDCDIREGSTLHASGGKQKVGKVVALDPRTRTIDIKKRKDSIGLHPTAVFPHDHVGADVLAESLFRLGEWVASHGMDGTGKHRAARDLLLALPPRCAQSKDPETPLQDKGISTLDAARRLATELKNGVLPIQGPPGTGKTYTGAHMICELIQKGKKVGITAVSHKVIRNLLNGVVEAASKEGLRVRCVQKVGDLTKGDDGIRETKKNEDVLDALAASGPVVAAGTAWLWSREDFSETLDVLFVDEAGQMSLANVLAVASAAKNLVLLGDPQQLEQPQQGSHPEGCEVSALEHLLRGEKTISPERGLFIENTWRLHPDICKFTSELFYENRLESKEEMKNQHIAGTGRFDGTGLWFEPVEHDGNRNSSLDEVERVAEIYEALLTGKAQWTNADGQQRRITNEDILIVAPYNAQVGHLGKRLPGARIGTVDKFQGQEAPVVIYSMATSTAEDAPRGMEFLFSLNRLNVATSRARCACILVASPRLFEPECRTPRQVQLANAFCRYLELANTT